MGFIGKLLVVVHGALSLAVLGWATGVFTHRIDWNNPEPKEGQEPIAGVFAKQKERVEEYNVGVDKAFTRWSGNLAQVQVLEAERYPRRAFYAEQLELVKKGTRNGKAEADPVRVQVIDPRSGYFDIQPTLNRPVFYVRDEKKTGDNTGVKALSIADYEKLMGQRLVDIAASQKANAQYIVDRDKLNKEINGVTEPMLVKGLRAMLSEQLTLRDRADAEDRYVIGFVTNNEAEFDLVRKRRNAMQLRIVQLEDWIKKGRPD
jgi:hypothetical protein